MTDIQTKRPHVTTDSAALWDALLRLEIGCPTDALSFSARLSRENGWSKEFSDRCIEEYKRFIFLAMVAGHAVTPSDQVDQVWHLHLTYSRAYWMDLCEEILKTPLHHEPTKGGPIECAKYEKQYEQTLKTYEKVFGAPAPADIWPDIETRFKNVAHFIRLNRADYWCIRKTRFLLPILIISPLLISTISHQETERRWVGWYIITLVLLYFLQKLWKMRNHSEH